MQLILIRHGEPDLSQGNDDPPLSSRGVRQASETAARLALEPVDRIITSPLLRARQTADALASRLNLEVEVAEGVAEVDRWGASYVSVEALRRQGGQPWANFLADPVGTLGGDEQLFRQEVTASIREIAQSTHGRTAIATHGLPINLILAELLGLEGLTNFAPHHASVTRLHIGLGGRMSVLSVNEITHLNRDES
ncbi:MAG: histidine phosphatase family protein [Pseudomonadota bacterium]